MGSKKKEKLTKAQKKERNQELVVQKVRELQELEARVSYLHTQNQKIQARIAQYHRSKRSAAAVGAHLMSMDKKETEDEKAITDGTISTETTSSDKRLYIQMGKAFIHSTQEQIEIDLENKIKEADAQLPTLENIHAQFEIKLKLENTNMLQLRRDFMKLAL